MNIHRFLAAAIALVLFSSTLFALEREYSVNGIVKDTDGNPVEGAVIKNLYRNDNRGWNGNPDWVPEPIITDKEGKFQFRSYSKPSGFRAIKEGIGIAHKQIFNTPKNVDVELVLQKGKPRLVQVINKKGEPIANCKVRVGNIGPPATASIYTTDKEGKAEVGWETVVGTTLSVLPEDIPPQFDKNGEKINFLSPFAGIYKDDKGENITLVLEEIGTLNVIILNPNFDSKTEKWSFPPVHYGGWEMHNGTVLGYDSGIGYRYIEKSSKDNLPQDGKFRFAIQGREGQPTPLLLRGMPSSQPGVFAPVKGELGADNKASELQVTLERGTLVKVKLIDETNRNSAFGYPSPNRNAAVPDNRPKLWRSLLSQGKPAVRMNGPRPMEPPNIRGGLAPDACLSQVSPTELAGYLPKGEWTISIADSPHSSSGYYKELYQTTFTVKDEKELTVELRITAP